MARATNAVASRRRRKRVLKAAAGYRGGRHRLFRTAVEVVRKGMAYSFAHRRRKKGDYRAAWIARIQAAVEQRGWSYSQFMNGLSKANIELNRKMLSEIAIHDPAGFDTLFNQAKAAVN